MSTKTRVNKGISRRSVVVGTAWAVPAIVVAGPAPHASATPIPPVTIGGTACKLPGNSSKFVKNGVAFQLTITNPYKTPLTVTITSVTKSGDVAPTQIIPTSFIIDPGTHTVVLSAGPYNNSANAQVSVGYSYTDPTTGNLLTGTAGPTTVNIVPIQGSCPFSLS